MTKTQSIRGRKIVNVILEVNISSREYRLAACICPALVTTFCISPLCPVLLDLTWHEELKQTVMTNIDDLTGTIVVKIGKLVK